MKYSQKSSYKRNSSTEITLDLDFQPNKTQYKLHRLSISRRSESTIMIVPHEKDNERNRCREIKRKSRCSIKLTALDSPPANRAIKDETDKKKKMSIEAMQNAKRRKRENQDRLLQNAANIVTIINGIVQYLPLVAWMIYLFLIS